MSRVSFSYLEKEEKQKSPDVQNQALFATCERERELNPLRVARSDDAAKKPERFLKKCVERRRPMPSRGGSVTKIPPGHPRRRRTGFPSFFLYFFFRRGQNSGKSFEVGSCTEFRKHFIEKRFWVQVSSFLRILGAILGHHFQQVFREKGGEVAFGSIVVTDSHCIGTGNAKVIDFLK